MPQGARDSAAVPVWVTSHNRSSVDVYYACGQHDAMWLGEVEAKERDRFEVPDSHARCVRGLNFFLVHRGLNRGYWVGPLALRTGSGVRLTIEKYAGLSGARVAQGLD
jgi:hypothetical protein